MRPAVHVENTRSCSPPGPAYHLPTTTPTVKHGDGSMYFQLWGQDNWLQLKESWAWQSAQDILEETLSRGLRTSEWAGPVNKMITLNTSLCECPGLAQPLKPNGASLVKMAPPTFTIQPPPPSRCESCVASFPRRLVAVLARVLQINSEQKGLKTGDHVNRRFKNFLPLCYQLQTIRFMSHLVTLHLLLFTTALLHICVAQSLYKHQTVLLILLIAFVWFWFFVFVYASFRADSKERSHRTEELAAFVAYD